MVAQFLFLILTVQAAFAKPAETCDLLLSVPPLIARTTQPISPIEDDGMGLVYPFGERVPPLNSGMYLFLVSESGELVIAPKYDPLKHLAEGKGLVTHKALLSAYSRHTGESLDDRVAGAGELVMAFGQVARVENRSGNYKGGEKNLEFAVGVLKHDGLVFTDKTTVVVHDPNNPDYFGHNDKSLGFDRWQLLIQEEVLQNPQGPKLLSLYERFGRLMVQISPKHTVYDAGGLIIETAIKAKRKHAIMEFTYPFATVATVDGLYFGIWKQWQSLKERNVAGSSDFHLSGPYHIQTLIDNVPMTDAQKVELQEISDEFSQLGQP